MKGPYVIAAVVRTKVYTLSFENGDPAEGGAEFDEFSLVDAS